MPPLFVVRSPRLFLNIIEVYNVLIYLYNIKHEYKYY